jgi:hypothetical protein
MGHYAKVLDGQVTQVIVAEADFFNTFVDSSPGTWIKTSYKLVQIKASLCELTMPVLDIHMIRQMTYFMRHNLIHLGQFQLRLGSGNRLYHIQQMAKFTLGMKLHNLGY